MSFQPSRAADTHQGISGVSGYDTSFANTHAYGSPTPPMTVSNAGAYHNPHDMATVTVTGIDSNHDGIPDSLEHGGPMSVRGYQQQAVESVGYSFQQSQQPYGATLTRPPTVQTVEHHQKEQVTDYVTMRQEQVVQVPQVQVVEKTVPVTHEVDRVTYETVAKPQQVQYTNAQRMAQSAPPPMASVTVTGVDANHDGIPDVLQGQPAPSRVVSAQAVRTVPAPPARPYVVQQETVQAAPVVHTRPLAPTPAPAPAPVHTSSGMKGATAPFCAEFVGTLVLVFTAGLAAMYGVGTPMPSVKDSSIAPSVFPFQFNVPREPDFDWPNFYWPSFGNWTPLFTPPETPARTAYNNRGYCRRCDGSLQRTSSLQQGSNVTDAATPQGEVTSLLQSAKSFQLGQAWQKALSLAAASTFWCSSTYFSPIWGIFILCIIYGLLLFFLRPISGAHMNPAVTFASYLSGKMPAQDMLIYWCAQILGALLASIIFAIFVGFDCFGVGPRVGFTWWQVGFVEMLFTGFLAFTVLSIHPLDKGSPKENKYNIYLYPLTVVCSLCAGIAACSHISGAFLNPAVTIALQIVSALMTAYGEQQSTWWFWYVCNQMLGGFVAAVIFYICRPDERTWHIGGRNIAEHGIVIFSLTTKLACEFVGTWILTFTIACSFWSGLKVEPLAGAACLFAIYTALCMVCGGHFNPAVTLAVMISERHEVAEWLHDGLFYMLAQCGAAILACLMCAAIHYGATFEAGTTMWSFWGLVELIFMATLVLVFLACTMTRDEVVVTHLRYQIGLALAFCFAIVGVLMDWFVMSGSYMNPAVALGLSTSHWLLNAGRWWGGIAVIFFDLLGGLLAYAAFTAFHKQDDNKGTAGYRVN